ncbi:P-loop containing nucleoside triphosphate hydrolase protein [Mycena pura]|uniref:DNA 3'-5' helicase n=1 Tax=Mycena pura TaxID=153505 RepID=A0AAD6VRG3_9AGAR|nr:P-loop containing nucleoside triphosphate hydrolase protein [Mycena pura]
MAPQYRWTDAQGRQTLRTIVKNLIPQWPNGLYSYQEEVVLRILDGQDVLCCLNTGGGKSAMFSVPLIALREVAKNPDLYPNLPTRSRPVGILITPTVGLAANIVHELKKLDLPAFAYCHDTITESRKNGENLVKIIQECSTYSLICLDPEHLRDKAWRRITSAETFRSNVVFGGVDEAHLIKHWGAHFRPHFKHIGAFFRGRLPSSASVFGLSATIQPGADTDSICRTNDFPELLDYLNQNRKTVIHCRRIEDLHRLFVYAFDSLPPDQDRLRRIKTYHSLHSFDDNAETLRLLDEDPMCQAVFATVAFTNGLNIRSLTDSLAYGFPSTLDLKIQEAGRVGRNPDTTARAVTFVQPKVLTDAARQISGRVEPPKISRKTGKPVRVRKSQPIEHAAALVLSESTCYTAAINKIYRNPPLETSTLDCISAHRPLPCSLCATRKNIKISFSSPPLPAGVTLAPFCPPSFAQSPPLSTEEKKLKLKKKERDLVVCALEKFANGVRLVEQRHTENQHRPKSSYFPSTFRDALAANLLSLNSLFDVHALVSSWIFAASHAGALYDLVVELQATIRSDRDTARLKKNAKQRASRTTKQIDADDVDEEAEEGEESESADDEHSPPSSPAPPPAKRSKTVHHTVLEDVTNQSRSKRRAPSSRKPTQKGSAKASLPTVASITADFGPAYRTTSDRRRTARGG